MFIPSGKQVSQTVGFVGNLLNHPIVEGSVGYAGIPVPLIGAKIKETRSEEALKDPSKTPKGPINWIRERLLTYGIVGGIIAWVGSFISGRMHVANPEENAKFAWLSGVLKLVGLAGIASSGFSQYKGWHVKKVNGNVAHQRYMNAGKIPDLMQDPNMDELKKRFETRHLIKHNRAEHGDIQRVENKILNGERVKVFYIGESQTGKTHTMSSNAMLIKQFEEEIRILNPGQPRQEVVMKVVSAGKLSDSTSSRGLFGSVIDLAKNFNAEGAQAAEQVGNILKANPQEALELAVAGMLDEATKAKEKGQRLVILIDEMDKIWNMALKDNQVDLSTVGLIATRFQELLEFKDLDVLITGNGTLDQICFLDKLRAMKDFSDDQAPELMGLRTRLEEIRISMTTPTYATQSEIIANRILEAGKVLNKPLDEYLDPGIVAVLRQNCALNDTPIVINESNHAKVEEILAQIIDQALYSEVSKIDLKQPSMVDSYLHSNPEFVVEAKALAQLNGGYINNIIMDKYCTDIVSGCAKGLNKKMITLDGIHEYVQEILKGETEKLNKDYAVQITTRKRSIYDREIQAAEDKAKLTLFETVKPYKELREKYIEVAELYRDDPKAAHIKFGGDEKHKLISEVGDFLDVDKILKFDTKERLSLKASQLLQRWNVELNTVDVESANEVRIAEILEANPDLKKLNERVSGLSEDDWTKLAGLPREDMALIENHTTPTGLLTVTKDVSKAVFNAKLGLAKINRALAAAS